ncbi:hypothetical protein ACIQNU_41745 [Streptomyces sp. NPDC091292]|uniref:hypothetical protein n=1 Tax=Streptomyces sp. NPDC091292 TaxID=3365991 RepID=UPI00381994D3
MKGTPMYTEESLLDSRVARAALADRTHALADVKRLPLLPDGDHLTAAMLAEYFEIDTVVLRRVVRKHAAELTEHGYQQLQGEPLKTEHAGTQERGPDGRRVHAPYGPGAGDAASPQRGGPSRAERAA